MPEPLQRLPRGLLRNLGGDRVMAQVLAIVSRNIPVARAALANTLA